MRKLLAFMSALALAIMPYTASAAILEDVHGTVNGTTSCTLNLNIASGASLWVAVWEDGTDISSVSWNTSETLTLVDANNTWSTNLRTNTYYLANPTSGSHSVTVAFTGTSGVCAVMGVTYTGTAASPLGAHGTRNFGNGALTENLTTTADGSEIFWFNSNNNSGTLTAGANTALLNYQATPVDGTDHGTFSATTTTAGGYTLNGNQNVGTGWQGAILEIKAGAAATVSVPLNNVILFGF